MDTQTPTLYGQRIIISELLGPKPKLQLSESFKYYAPEFRSEFDAWLLDQFGVSDPVIHTSGTFFISRQNYHKLEYELRRHGP